MNLRKCVLIIFILFCEEINRFKVVTIVGKDSHSCCIWSQCTRVCFICWSLTHYLLPYLIWCVCLSFKTQCSTWHMDNLFLLWFPSSQTMAVTKVFWASFSLHFIHSHLRTSSDGIYWFLSFVSFALGMQINRFTKFGGTHLLCQHVESRGRRITIAQG